ncbi:alpha/beta hydrolase [Luteibacter yeojuensis]|uniref:Alpha/beta hydrolase n=1 Tax=Luteibacter yeojuensis TaxID=345309 RepID=A0A7X5QTL0_9GAMM|nr:alpha/beta hydrolase [Luteibacter yeojuensis]NID15144.1 alpha/beta hydrolase [Luteibacter yeojuensis]
MTTWGLAQAASTKPPVIDNPVYAHPARLVDIGAGQRLNLYCLGSGSPTVVMDAGMGDSMISWALVQPVLAQGTRVCSFDRAGLGFSDAARRPGTPVNQSEDLHALLHAAKIKPPYVLVGHSLAGLNVRVFADKYRSEVVGMVIVDGSHEDQSSEGWALAKPGDKAKYEQGLKDLHACIAAARQGLVKGTKMFETCVGDTDDPRFSPAINKAQETYAVTERWQAAVASERENVFYASAEETRKTRTDFGDMPIIVLTHSPFPKRSDESQEERNLKTLSWEGLHLRVAAMSTRGINEIVPDAGHYIQYDKPQVVIDAVNQAVRIGRTQSTRR